MRNKLQLFLTAVLSVYASSAFSAAEFVNGSFEDPAIPGLVWAYPSSLPGWTAWTGLNTFNIHGNALWPAQDGQQHIEFDSQYATLSQTVSGFVVGNQYEVIFGLAGNPDYQAVYGLSLVIDAGIGTLFIGDFTADSHGYDHSNIGWVDNSLGFTALSDTITFQFNRTDTEPDGYGPELDNVRLVASVPEPETYALMVVGLGLMGTVLRRRKN